MQIKNKNKKKDNKNKSVDNDVLKEVIRKKFPKGYKKSLDFLATKEVI
jgi:hypothetical protein